MSLTDEQKRTLLYSISFFIAIAAIGFIVRVLLPRNTAPWSTTFVSPIQKRISAGERVLAREEAINSENQRFGRAKERGVEAIAKRDYDSAVNELEAALNEYKNAPETLIYLNNARIGDNRSYTIAVSIPLYEDEVSKATLDASKKYEPNASAILRGVAQAQQEVNAAGGIDGVLLKVVIVDDDNDKEVAKKAVEELAKNQEVLGVIGHFSSGTTLAAKEVYDRIELTAISGASTSVDLSDRDYVFRTVPSDAFTAEKLADYMLNTLGQQKVVIFYDSKSNYSKSLKSTFVREVEKSQGKIIAEFDFDNPDFNANDDVNYAIEEGAEVIMLAAHGGNLPQVYKVVQANNRKLNLLGGDELNNIKILNNSKELATNMVVSVAWVEDVRSEEFVSQAKQLWGDVKLNWHTAMTYDAAQAFITAIRLNPSRDGVYQELLNNDFSASGASSRVRFTFNGDRASSVYLIKVEPSNPSLSGTGYDFVPVPE